MPARTIDLPNVRRMFIPDSGYMMIDVDLERADAQVVAWDADDEELKEIFKSGKDVHTENAMAVYKCSKEEVHLGGANSPRQRAKQMVHGTNYGSSAKTLAAETNSTLAEAEEFIQLWFEAHPKIKLWHDKIQSQLLKNRTVTNAFGYHNVFFDRIDYNRFHEALAWIPQSTVAITTNLGLINIDRNLPQVQLLLQVHDSLVMQAPISECPDIVEEIRKQMRVEVPYADPLYINTSAAMSPLSWGDVFELSNVERLLDAAKETDDLEKLALKFKSTPESVANVLSHPEWYKQAA